MGGIMHLNIQNSVKLFTVHKTNILMILLKMFAILFTILMRKHRVEILDYVPDILISPEWGVQPFLYLAAISTIGEYLVSTSHRQVVCYLCL